MKAHRDDFSDFLRLEELHSHNSLSFLISFSLFLYLVSFALLSILQVLIILLIIPSKKERDQTLDKNTLKVALYASLMGQQNAQKKLFNKQRTHSESRYCQLMTSVSSVIRNKNVSSGGWRGRKKKNGVSFSSESRKMKKKNLLNVVVDVRTDRWVQESCQLCMVYLAASVEFCQGERSILISANRKMGI